VFSYIVRAKVTYAGKPVRLKKEIVDEAITAVRSEIYDLSH
jgi:hypothetical protein